MLVRREERRVHINLILVAAHTYISVECNRQASRHPVTNLLAFGLVSRAGEASRVNLAAGTRIHSSVVFASYFSFLFLSVGECAGHSESVVWQFMAMMVYVVCCLGCRDA